MLELMVEKIQSWTMGDQLTFTGGGELDNGLNVALSFVDNTMVMQTEVWRYAI